jgi:hypothetical protein
VLLSLRDFMNEAQLELKGAETRWEEVGVPAGAGKLLNSLRKAKAWDDLLESGEIPRDSILRLPYPDPPAD